MRKYRKNKVAIKWIIDVSLSFSNILSLFLIMPLFRFRPATLYIRNHFNNDERKTTLNNPYCNSRSLIAIKRILHCEICLLADKNPIKMYNWAHAKQYSINPPSSYSGNVTTLYGNVQNLQLFTLLILSQYPILTLWWIWIWL